MAASTRAFKPFGMSSFGGSFSVIGVTPFLTASTRGGGVVGPQKTQASQKHELAKERQLEHEDVAQPIDCGAPEKQRAPGASAPREQWKAYLPGDRDVLDQTQDKKGFDCPGHFLPQAFRR